MDEANKHETCIGLKKQIRNHIYSIVDNYKSDKDPSELAYNALSYGDNCEFIEIMVDMLVMTDLTAFAHMIMKGKG